MVDGLPQRAGDDFLALRLVCGLGVPVLQKCRLALRRQRFVTRAVHVGAPLDQALSVGNLALGYGKPVACGGKAFPGFLGKPRMLQSCADRLVVGGGRAHGLIADLLVVGSGVGQIPDRFGERSPSGQALASSCDVGVQQLLKICLQPGHLGLGFLLRVAQRMQSFLGCLHQARGLRPYLGSLGSG